MKSYLKILLMIILGLLVCDCTYAENGTETVLSNGMKVFIKPMHAAPIVTVNYWVKSGAIYETEGEAGFSELISRMVFSNSLNYSNYTLKKEIQKSGFRFGKSSASDCQSYFFTGSSKDLDRILELSVDGLYNSIFSDDDLKKAIDDVKRDVAQLESRPDILVFNAMMQEAFTVHPCRRPFYGLNPNYNEANPFVLNRFYKKAFSPSNTTLIITGDVDPKMALNSIRRYVEPVRGNNFTEPQLPKEPDQTAYREVAKYVDVEKVYLSFGWKVPGFNSQDRYALYVVAKLLGGSEDSILWKRIIMGRQTGDFITASYEASRFESIFAISGISSKSKSDYFVNDVRRVINGMIDEFIPEQALEEAKRNIINEDIFNCEGVEASALNYGSFAMISSALEADNFANGIRSVNMDDVRRVIAEYLRDENLTVATLQAPPVAEDSAPTMLTLENGIKLIMKENHASPVISVACCFTAGGLRDDKRFAGISCLAGELLCRSYDTDDKSFRSKLEKLGARLCYDATKDYVSVNMKAVSSSFIPAFDMFVKMLDKCEFPSAYSRARKVLEDKLSLEEENQALVNEYNVLKSVFNGGPLSYSVYGKLDDLGKTKRSDVVDFYKKYFIPSNMVISVVGDFYPKELRDYLLASLGKISSKDSTKSKELKPTDSQNIKYDSPVTLKTKSDDAWITYVSLTGPAKDKKLIALEVGCRILENSLKESFKKADSDGKMASSVEINCKPFTTEGYFKAAVRTNKENVATAAQLLLLEIEAFKIGNITQDKLQAAKQSVFTQRAIGFTDNLSLAKLYSRDEILGLGFDFYSKYDTVLYSLTVSDIVEAAKEYMLPDKKFAVGVTSANASELTMNGNKLVFKSEKQDKKEETGKDDSKKEDSKKDDKSKK